MGAERDWDAPAKKSENEPNIERYLAKAGKQDLILVITPKPIESPYHWTGKFPLRCLEEEGALCCKKFGAASTSNSAYILHVAERVGQGEWQLVGRPKNWGFGEDKRLSLAAIFRDFCEKDPVAFRKTFICVSCVTEDKQELNLMPMKIPANITESQLGAMFALAKKEQGEFKKFITVDKADVLRNLERFGVDIGEGVGEEAPAEKDKSATAPPAEEAAVEPAKPAPAAEPAAVDAPSPAAAPPAETGPGEPAEPAPNNDTFNIDDELNAFADGLGA